VFVAHIETGKVGLEAWFKDSKHEALSSNPSMATITSNKTKG
jgi:hypothetical protein